MKKVVIILLVIVIAPFLVEAQGWTLQQCVDTATKNNLNISQEYNSVQTALLNYNQSFWSRYPTLNAMATQNFNFGRSLDQSTYQFNDRRSATNNFSLNSGVILYNGGQIRNTIRQYQLILDASQYDLQQLKDQISLNVVNAFITILYANESVKNVQLQIQSTKELIRQTEIFVEAGKKAESDLAQLNAQLATEKYNLITAQGNLRTANLSLQQLMEIPYSEKFEIQVPALPEADLNPLLAATDIYSLALKTQPSIKSSELQKKVEQFGLEIARASLYPKLSLNAGLNSNYSSLSKLSGITTTSTIQTIGYLKNDPNTEVVNYVERNLYTSRDYPFFQQLSDRFNQFVSLNLSIPIFNGKETRYAIRKQEINIKAAELNDKINKNNLRKTIEQAAVDANSAQMKYVSAQEALNAEDITYQNLQLLFEASKTTSIELLVEKNKLAVSNSQLLQAKYDLILRLKVLDYYEGKPLNLR